MQNKTPYQRQFEYMLRVGQIDKDGNMVESIEKQPDYLYFIKSEIKEFQEAFIKQNKIEMLDALADILVCTLGVAIKYKLDIQDKLIFKDGENGIERYCTHTSLISWIEILEQNQKIKEIDGIKQLLKYDIEDIWNEVLNEAEEHNFNIQGAFDVVMQNNLDRMLRDELGNVVLDTRKLLEDGSKNKEYGKVRKIKDFPKPDLSKFI